MNNNYLRDQRGVAMLLELVLVATVLALVGVAVYQANHQAAITSNVSPQATAAGKTASLADSAAAITETSAASDASISATADDSATELDGADVDMSNLGDSSSESSY